MCILQPVLDIRLGEHREYVCRGAVHYLLFVCEKPLHATSGPYKECVNSQSHAYMLVSLCPPIVLVANLTSVVSTWDDMTVF